MLQRLFFFVFRFLLLRILYFLIISEYSDMTRIVYTHPHVHKRAWIWSHSLQATRGRAYRLFLPF